MAPETWLAFVAASAVLLLIPGPTVLLVLSYATSQGRRVALASAGGVALGDFAAITASLAGLGAVVAASATALTALKWLGAAWLCWLGWRLLRSAPAQGPASAAAIHARGVFGHAAVVTALNPKSIAFFVAFVPQSVDPARAFAPQATIMVATFVGLAATNALAYALAADRLRLWLDRPDFTGWLTRLGGVTLIGMALATATLRRPS